MCVCAVPCLLFCYDNLRRYTDMVLSAIMKKFEI